jgi:alkanesulfonate monooxygenase SsuD/methylene tetrahydromethanopterin reductase-like flavin-dependent oxidoreductase (luciferase family)
MRFAVFDHNDASGRPTATQLAERLSLIQAYERFGYYAYQMAEHHSTPLGIATPHLLLAAASQRTSSIRLGPLISILPLVPPLRMVEEAATLDQLTGGRLVLGVGRGVSPIETGFHGVPGEEAQGRFDEADLPPLGISRQIVIADTNERATEIANRAFVPFRHNISYLWHKYNVPMPPVLAADTFEGIAATGHCYAGDPAGARAWVAEHAETAGISYVSLEFCFGDMTVAERSAQPNSSPPRSCPRSPE